MAAPEWRNLFPYLRENEPATAELYVTPSRDCASEIVDERLTDPAGNRTFLLVGARGGGKSTTLRAIERALRAQDMVIAAIDLDRSGISASHVTAFDLLYLSAVKLLEHVAGSDRETLFTDLAQAYAGEQEAAQLGTVEEALKGIAGFGGGVTAVAATAGLMTGAAPAIAGTAAAVAAGVKLLSRDEVVPESSPRGRRLQAASQRVARTVRSEQSGRPLCVVVDGLEKMNGQAAERFRQIFEETRLLADSDWNGVIAAPPRTLTEAMGVEGSGFTTRPNWGFGPDDLATLRQALEVRFRSGGIDPEPAVDGDGLERIAESSGGMPRDAVAITYQAVMRASRDGVETLSKSSVDDAIALHQQNLARLNLDYWTVLGIVHRRGQLPGNDLAATLFATGRVLAYPPAASEEDGRTRFVVHPLIRAGVEQHLRESEPPPPNRSA